MRFVDRHSTPPRMATAPPGWRARIGLIVPSSEPGQLVNEHEMIFPEGVAGLVTRVMSLGGTVEDLMRMEEDVEYAAELLATANPTCISYGCTSGSFAKGLEYDRTIIAKLHRIAAVPATTMSNAVAEALRAVHAKSLLVLCPYVEEVGEAALKYIQEQGFKIAHHKVLGLQDEEIFTTAPWETYEMTVQAFSNLQPGSIDAIQITCGGLRSAEIIEYVESTTGVPCITSNQANAWHCLKLAGIHEPIYGFGKLLESER